MKRWNKKTCAGLVLLLAAVWMPPVRFCADATTPPTSGNTVKRKSHPARKRATRSASARTAQQRSAHHPATRRVSSKSTRSTQHAATRRVSSKSRRSISARRRRALLRPEPERIQEIQQALAQAGYLHGQPSGRWDDQTREAMRRYQADHGFPATGLPEAKSLMKLGLGPHPLPEELDTSTARASGATANSDPVPSTTRQDPPAAGPQP